MKRIIWMCAVVCGGAAPNVAAPPTPKKSAAQDKSPQERAAQKAQKQKQARLEALDDQASELYYGEKYIEAIVIHEKLDREAPANARFAHNYGLTLFSLKRWDEAQRKFERAIQLDPQFAWSRQMLGEIALERNDLPRALELFEQARERAPEHAPPVFYLGILHEIRGDRVAAERAYRRALMLDPWPRPLIHARAANDLGQLLEVRGQYADAARMYRQAFEMDPKLTRARDNLAQMAKAEPVWFPFWLPRPGENRFPPGNLQVNIRSKTPGRLIWWDTGESKASPESLSSPNLQVRPVFAPGKTRSKSVLVPAVARFEIKDSTAPRSLKKSVVIEGDWKRIELRALMTAYDIPEASGGGESTGVTGVRTRWLGENLQPLSEGPRIVAEGTRRLCRIESGEVPPGATRLEIEMGLFASSGRLEVYNIELYVNPSYLLPFPASTPASNISPSAK